MLQLWGYRSFGRCKLRGIGFVEPALIGDLRTAPKSTTSTIFQGNPQHLANTISVPGHSLTRASHPQRSRARNHNATGTTRTVGGMDMDLHSPLTSENKGGRKNDRGWRPWMQRRWRKRMRITSSGTSRTGRYQRTNGTIAKSGL